MSEINPTPETQETVVSIPKDKYDEMVEKLASKTQSEANLVSEIKDIREKKQLSEAEAEDLKRKLAERGEAPAPTEITPETVKDITTKALAAALAEREIESAKNSRSNAYNTFISRHKEFHPDNDAGGLKKSALDRKLSSFNLNGLSTESDFLTVFEDAARLLNNTPAPRERGIDPNPPAPMSGGGAEPRQVDQDTLSAKELKIIDSTFGGDKERYLKQKAKRPDYVETLLQYAV